MSEHAESASDFYFDTVASPANAAVPQASAALVAADRPFGAEALVPQEARVAEPTATLETTPSAIIEVPTEASLGPWQRMGREVVAGVQTLVSAAVYATLIVTFGVQVARVDGLSMAPTLEDHDRLIVNKLV
ncbi:MAG TPA: S26 family signal peptidase, partial [Vicinamibacterales bacterium]|nr:S26 family signal peptidase [Vicinamibacterales bacterium]